MLKKTLDKETGENKSPQMLVLGGNKLMYHEKELLKWKKGDIFPPVYVEFGPTTFCNHACIHCYVEELIKKRTSLDDEVYMRFMEEIGDYGVKALLLAGCGEPLLHKSTPKALETAVKHGTDVALSTNGIPITDKNLPILMDNLTYLRLTINGGSKESYVKTHRCRDEDWEIILKTMDKLAEYKTKNNSKCTLGVYTVANDYNFSEIENWTKTVKEKGFEYIIIKPANPVFGVKPNKITYEELIPFLKKAEKQASDNFTVQARHDLFEEGYISGHRHKQCLATPFVCVVDSDGSVYTCNWFWGNKKFKYGNLNEKTFPEIWESERAKEIREKISSKNFDLSNCGACKQASLNEFLWKLNNGEMTLEKIKEIKDTTPLPEHINFI